MAPGYLFNHDSGNIVFEWNLETDNAQIRKKDSASPVWRGSLLPLFWIQRDGRRECLSCHVDIPSSSWTDAGGKLALILGELGIGELEFRTHPTGLLFSRLEINWKGPPRPIHSLYFGASLMDEAARAIAPSQEVPFWPDWQAEGVCVPSAKGAPVQSFFRRWDFGQADIALGNFGPAMGTPYAAAFPRPLFSAAFGGPTGWVALGAGTIPDAAMMLNLRASCAAIQYLYREDLWNGPTNSRRVWEHPLRLAWGDLAWDAFANLFATFDVQPTDSKHLHSQWTNWGDLLLGHDNIEENAMRAHDCFGAEVYGIEDGWETFNGSGEVNRKRYPDFDRTIQRIRDKGMEVHFWQATGWVGDPFSLGLTVDDLLCDPQGLPRRGSWSMNPRDTGPRYFLLDPSSENARAFLRRRTHSIMRQYRPSWLKLDFSYGLHGPNVTAPRNPAYRGERLGYELMKIIIHAAQEVNPDVTIQYYGIHPLMRPVCDVVALDDLGDAYGDESVGHGHWSIWASLCGLRGWAISGSSGYHWAEDPEVVLNTAILGMPGAVLSTTTAEGNPIAPSLAANRKAISRWFRRTVQWRPLWLNSEKGRLGAQPRARCWGRLEPEENQWKLTALALREENRNTLDPAEIRHLDWHGRWAIISQDHQDLWNTEALACIPMDAGDLKFPCSRPPEQILAIYLDGKELASPIDWSDGWLTLQVEPAAKKCGLMGFLINR